MFFLRCFLAAPHCFINYFIYSRVKAPYILYGETIPVTPKKLNQSDFYSLDQKKVAFSLKLFTTNVQEKSYLPN